jgi:putative methyltransferase (TIGR04325 family)
MSGSGLTVKLHRSIDIGIGLLIGWYRLRVDEPQPEQNPNAHYVRENEALDLRIANAMTGALTSDQLARVYSVAELVRGIDRPRICDFGGAYGEDCLRFRRYIPDAVCTVVEIPEIVESAKRVDALKDISFSTVPSACDVLFSGGVVMNAHEPLFEAIKALNPPGLVISSVEITDSPTYWSMVVYRKTKRRCPYITFNRREFIDRVAALGYTLTDTWHQGENTSGVFLNGQRNPDAYGFAFMRDNIADN